MRRHQREEEFTRFFAEHGPGLRRTASYMLRDWHLAEDLTQQALVKLYGAWARTRPETRVAFARKIVVNECLSHLRRHRLETSLPQVQEDAAPVPQDVLDLDAALALLPPRQRAIIALRYLDDLTIAEVGRLLNIADGTVKSQSARALETLRAHLPEFCTAITAPQEAR